jgi:hypothetical protein
VPSLSRSLTYWFLLSHMFIPSFFVSWLSSLYSDVRVRLQHMLYTVGGLVCHAIHWMTGTGWVYYTIWFYVVLLVVGSVTSIFPEFWVLVRGRVYLASGALRLIFPTSNGRNYTRKYGWALKTSQILRLSWTWYSNIRYVIVCLQTKFPETETYYDVRSKICLTYKTIR